MPARRPAQAAYQKLQRATDKQLRATNQRLADGKLTPKQWYDRQFDILERRHGEAAALGRQRAGSTGPMNDDDRQFGGVILDEESRFLFAFLQDIEAGRYTDEADADDESDTIRVAALNARTALYAKKLRATAAETFVKGSPRRLTFAWELGDGVENHCPECPLLAKGSPYEADDLPTLPGAGDTTCLCNCLCHLRRSDGVTCFKP